MFKWLKKNKEVLLIIGGFLTALGFLADYFAGDKIIAKYNEFVWTNPAKEDFKNKKFNIVILNFNRPCVDDKGDTSDVGQVLRDKLADLIDDDSLSIGVYYDATFTPDKNFDHKDAIQRRDEKYGAHLIIYGKTNYCSSEICLKYGIKANFKNSYNADFLAPSLANKSKSDFQKFSSIGGLREGELQGDIHYLIYMFSGIAALEAEEYPKANTYFTKAIRRKPENKWGYYYRAQYGNFDSVFQDINRALKIDSDFAEAYNLRGQIYGDQKKYNKALSDFNKAIKLDPNDAPPYNNRGLLYENQKKYKKALSDYNKAIKLDPNNASPYNNRGGLYYNQKKYNKALCDYNKAIKLDTNNASPYNNRGGLYYNQKKYNKALCDYNKAIKLDTNNASPYNNRGLLYTNQKKYNKALSDYNKAIKLDTNNASPYNNRGLLYKNQKKYNKALSDYNKAIKLDQNLAIAYYNRAFTKQAMSLNFCSDLKKAANLGLPEAKQALKEYILCQ